MSVRVLVVDDSAVMRRLVCHALSSDPQLEVVGTASNPFEARERIKELNPDVMTLDVEMPGMDGLSFLEKVMTLRPMPVVMCSTLTQRGADATIEALRLGAVSCFPKPADVSQFAAMGPTLARMVLDAAGVRVRARIPQAPAKPKPSGSRRQRLVAVGASTGGVEALFTLLSAMPADCPPTVIVQHMPAMFTGSFAQRLNQYLAPEVVEATDGLSLRRGLIAIAPGGLRHMVVSGGSAGVVRLQAGDPVSGHRPSVDMLFRSVAKLGADAVGIILTGMGSDGAQGLLEMRQAGARTLGQDEASCVVYGMPRAAAAIGAVERELPLNRIATAALEAACHD